MRLQLTCAVLGVLLAASCAPHAPPAADPHVAMLPADDITPPRIVREFRGAWVSPVWNADWPSRPGLSPDSQRAELRAVFDRAQQVGLNAIVLHVRMAADAMYPTPHAPWSVYLTGEVGRAPVPAYDPLAYAVREAHARGLELHAWFNPFRAAPPDRKVSGGTGHVSATHPKWIVRYGSQTWLDPGLPEVRQYVLKAIIDVVDRYDVDGVHLDDYFYPYLEEGAKPFADTASWARYGVRAGWQNRGDWRRDNINQFVETLYREVKARKQWVSVGISPFGIWRPNNPVGVTGLNSYTEIFADSRRWFREGWVDYLAPQLYWPIDGSQDRFRKLESWWNEQNVKGRHLWPGLHTAREVTGKTRWPGGEVTRQIETVRAGAIPQKPGHIHFRLKSVFDTAERLNGVYAQPSLPPAMPWLDARAPGAPAIAVAPGAENFVLRVTRTDSVPVRWLAVQTLRNGTWTLAVRPATDHLVLQPVSQPLPAAVSVTAISPTGIESAASVLRGN